MGFLNSLRNGNSQNDRVYPAQNKQVQQGRKQLPTLQEFRANPVALLRAEGYRIPDGMTDPEQLTQYIIKTGQVRNGRLGLIQRVVNSLK